MCKKSQILWKSLLIFCGYIVYKNGAKNFANMGCDPTFVNTK